MHKKLPVILLIAEIICFSYLVWWYYWSPYYGYYEINPCVFPAFIFSVFLTLLFIILGIRALFAKKKLLPLLIIPFVWFLIVFDVFKSPVVYYREETDFSIHERLKLYENGTYDLMRVAQTFVLHYEGTYLCRNDSVLLSEAGGWNADNTKRILKVDNTISFNNYEGAYLLHTHKITEKDKSYWKILLLKWLWLR